MIIIYISDLIERERERGRLDTEIILMIEQLTAIPGKLTCNVLKLATPMNQNTLHTTVYKL